MQRNPSTSTVRQARPPSSSLKTRPAPPQAPSTPQGKQRETERRSLDASSRTKQTSLLTRQEESAISSSSDSDAPAPLLTQYRPRTYSRQSQSKGSSRPTTALSEEAQESEDSPPFLPFSNPTIAKQQQQQQPQRQASDPSATLRITSQPHFKTRAATADDKTQGKSPTTHSSSSSSFPQSTQPPSPPLNALSPQRQRPKRPAALSSLSPRQRRQLQRTGAAAASGSDTGTSGIGSSFSDLDDDFSGTQSALEEALAGEMERGGVVSRISTLF